MPMYKIDHQKMTPEEISHRQKEWADYVRKRLRPTKTCAKCHATYPNDREHFQVNPNGRLLSVCTHCAPVETKPQPSQKKQTCPCCEKRALLVSDRHAPAPVLLCRPCLNLVNGFEAASQKTLEHMANYVEWRRQGNAARFTVQPPTQENGAAS